MLAALAMTERDVIVAFAWIIGIGIAALGVLLSALANWVVKHIEGLRGIISIEMRSFDVRLARLETLTGLRRQREEDREERHHDTRRGDDD